MYEYVDVIDVT